MTSIPHQVAFLDGRWDGRTVRESLPEVISDVVAAARPLQVIVFGSLARGDEGPESDADLLVVLDHLDRSNQPEVMATIRRAIRAPIPVDVLVTDPDEIAERGTTNGSSIYWPLREGRVSMTDPPPDLVAAEARRWLSEADEELRIARYLSEDDTLPARAACFHAHLAAEKALNAVLIQRGVPLPRLHDLVALQRMLPSAEQQRFSNSDLDELNPWTIEGRYPADLSDVATGRITSLLNAANRALNSARTAIENTSSTSAELQHPASGQTDHHQSG